MPDTPIPDLRDPPTTLLPGGGGAEGEPLKGILRKRCLQEVGVGDNKRGGASWLCFVSGGQCGSPSKCGRDTLERPLSLTTHCHSVAH